MNDFKAVKFKTHIDKLPHLLGMHYLEIPERIIKKIGGSFKVRVICTVNDQLTFQGGLVALGEGRGYISIHQKKLRELKLKAGDEVTLELKPDPSKYGMPVPEELQEVFNQDPIGKKRFDKLNPAKQRYIIYYVSQVKSSQLRIDRALLLIGNLKALSEGNEEFRDILGKKR